MKTVAGIFVEKPGPPFLQRVSPPFHRGGKRIHARLRGRSDEEQALVNKISREWKKFSKFMENVTHPVVSSHVHGLWKNAKRA